MSGKEGMSIDELRQLKVEDLKDGFFLEALNEYLAIAISDLEKAGKDPGEKRRVVLSLERHRSEEVYHIMPKIRVRLATDYPDVVESLKFRRYDPRQLELIAGGRR